MNRKLLSLILAVGVLATTVSPTAARSKPDQRIGMAEGFRMPERMDELNAGWERIVLPWDQLQPGGKDDFSKLGQTLTDATIQRELDRGTQIVGLFQFTAPFARPAGGSKSSVPSGLNLAFDDPSNSWGQFAFRTAQHYKGRIDRFIIWNEPDYRPATQEDFGSRTWLGTDAEFAQLMRVGYLAIKKANPNAVVSFAATTYWADETRHQPQFYDRFLTILDGDPTAAANNWYHDVTSLNLYQNPDDVRRVYGVFKSIQKAHGIDKPVWLSEANAMPKVDPNIPCSAEQAAKNNFPTTMQEQASYGPQMLAMAASAGYQKWGFYRINDGDTCNSDRIWGALRDSGEVRPVKLSYQVGISLLENYLAAQFVPLERLTEDWSAWPGDPTSYTPNYQIYQVAFDKPGGQRVTVLWNGDGSPNTVRIPKNGTSAKLVLRDGETVNLDAVQGWWVADLAGATAHYPGDPDGYFYIGGSPVYIVEEGVDPATPVIPPTVGKPGNLPQDFLFAMGQQNGITINRGEAADFYIKTRGQEGLRDPITFSILSWSSQRFPEPKDGSSLPFAATFLPGDTVSPGTTVDVHFDTSAAPEGGIFFITVQMSTGAITKTVDLALVLN